MSYPTKIAYPCPPPTTNSLTSQQRSQLLRTTQKLGRLLGTTPALIEESDSMPSMLPLNLQRLAVPLHIQLSSVYDDGDALNRYPSSETSSTSSNGSPLSLKRSSSSASEYSSRSGRTLVNSTTSVHVNESWPKADRPFLRIATKSPSKLEAIPQSPPATGSPPPAYSPEPPHTSYTIRPVHTRRNSAPPSPPAFDIPNPNSVRRQKMDRLRRTLGDGVPLDLVFPDEETSSASQARPISYGQAPPHTQQRIRSARDSLVLSPHQRFDIPAARPAPTPPMPTPRSEKKLSIIAEREEPRLPAPSERASTDSEQYQGDNEADSPPTRHRRASRLYDETDARRIKRVPVPAA
ncbi:hypothetical protein DFH07DRAFT_284100 [Mycena maculata]|uniref:Uncharacterized protein n=1 Tax=Mycena maculata TaxID=230809 RepID=A0AAD7HKL2_9AGAR|nr:hypothetical protein DFH07DRAFT_284100 [Mycena maculata]